MHPQTGPQLRGIDTDRRRWLSRLAAAGSAATLVALNPRLAWANAANAATDARLVFIIQRGAADGLETVVPVGDPAFAPLRGALAPDPASLLRLDADFALHGALGQCAELFRAGQALAIHAVALPYRDRSHFDAQNMLESGGAAPYRVQDGWMNRLLALLAPAQREAIAFAPTIPLALRGAQTVASYAPSAVPQADEDLLARVGRLYESDAMLHGLWQRALQTREQAGSMGAGAALEANEAGQFGRTAGAMLAGQEGPRLAMIETGGWDTHRGQSTRLAAQLRSLDALIGGLRQGLGAQWARTTVLIATEFGRAAVPNGTGGTDHGTASAALLVGGAVQGGRVLTEWPGLAGARLHEGRDLRPTRDLNGLIAAVAADTFALDREQVARQLHPGLATDLRAWPALTRRA